MIIAVDFDGTICKQKWPEIGEPVPGAIEGLKKLLSDGHLLILYTLRNGPSLVEALDYLNRHEISLWGINDNPRQKHWSASKKIHAHVYIDDAAYGCPLVYPEGTSMPYVDWTKIRL